MTLLPKSLEAAPRIADWLCFEKPGRIAARSGRVEMGQGIAIALKAIVAQALSVAPEAVDLTAGDTRFGPDENYTAGSMSVELGGLSLRAAALAARALLLAAARQAMGEHCDLSGGRAMAGDRPGPDLWTLAAACDFGVAVASVVPAPLPPDQTDPGALAEVHIRDRLQGGVFLQDMVLERMVHARVLYLPHPQARLVALDRSAIETLPGVISLYRDGSFAAVIAATEAEAAAAAARADALADWDIPQGGRQRPADLLGDPPPERMIESGPPAEGNRRVACEFSRPFLTHASIGTVCALALWSGGRLTVWSQAQGPFQLRAALAEALDLAAHDIAVIHRPGAGCYGHNGADDVAFEAALLARALPDRPLRLVWRRRDELTRGPLAPAMTSRAQITLSPEGRIAAMALDILSAPHQRRPGPGRPGFAAGPLLSRPLPLPAPVEPPPANGGGADRNAVPLYTLPALSVTRRVATDLPLRSSAMRALGAFANVAAIELAMDAAAEAVAADPVAFRLDHLDDGRAVAVIRRAVALSGFTAETDGETAMGLGFARYKNKAGYCAAVVEVRAGAALAVPRLWAVADVGEAIDPDGVRAQVEGGAIQALSWSLKEEVPITAGAPDLAGWDDYPILRFSEIPEIAVELIGDPALPPLGAGEIAQGPVAAALACAVRRLFALDRVALPLTPAGLAAQLLQ